MYTIFRGGNIGDGEYFYKNDDLQISEQFVKDNTILKKDCFITPSVTSIEHIGKIALIDTNLENTVAGGFVLIIYPILEDSNLLKYFLYALSSKYHKDNCKKITNKSGQAFYNISREKLMQLLVPLPPLMEQKRISKKIKLFLPYINNYNNIYSKLETLNTNYKEELKKSILQYAIQGKLVRQNSNDETAEVLINKILEEKRELIKTKQIKNENLSVIYKDDTDNQFYEKFDDGKIVNITDEIPFEIPNSWCWTRLYNIGNIVGGGTPKTDIKENWNNATIPWLTPADMKNIKGKYAKRGERNISEIGLKNSSAKLMPKGTILYSSRAPIGYIAIANNDISTNQGFKSVVLIDMKLNKFLYYELIERTPSIISKASGTTFKEISGSEFGKILVAIPPYNEQIKIINKLECLFRKIETAE